MSLSGFLGSYIVYLFFLSPFSSFFRCPQRLFIFGLGCFERPKLLVVHSSSSLGRLVSGIGWYTLHPNLCVVYSTHALGAVNAVIAIYRILVGAAARWRILVPSWSRACSEPVDGASLCSRTRWRRSSRLVRMAPHGAALSVEDRRTASRDSQDKVL